MQPGTGNDSEGERTLLITGFGLFDSYLENPSGTLATLLDGRGIGRWRIVGRQLDVDWERAWAQLEGAALDVMPQALLMLGVAPTPFFRLETLAKNALWPAADVRGALPQIGPRLSIDPEAPPAYWSTLPVEVLARRLKALYEERWPAQPEGPPPPRVSLFSNAGAYLCNYVFYKAMNDLPPEVGPRGFVHLPPIANAQGEGGVERDALFEAGEILVATLIELLDAEDPGDPGAGRVGTH